MINLLISIGERQQEALERHQELLEPWRAPAELLAEIHRDARQTINASWVRLTDAQRYGWLTMRTTIPRVSYGRCKSGLSQVSMAGCSRR